MLRLVVPALVAASDPLPSTSNLELTQEHTQETAIPAVYRRCKLNQKYGTLKCQKDFFTEKGIIKTLRNDTFYACTEAWCPTLWRKAEQLKASRHKKLVEKDCTFQKVGRQYRATVSFFVSCLQDCPAQPAQYSMCRQYNTGEVRKLTCAGERSKSSHVKQALNKKTLKTRTLRLLIRKDSESDKVIYTIWQTKRIWERNIYDTNGRKIGHNSKYLQYVPDVSSMSKVCTL